MTRRAAVAVTVLAAWAAGLVTYINREAHNGPAQRLAEAHEARRRATLAVVDAAVARGDLRPDVDGNLVLDLLGGLVWQRSWISATPLTDADLERVVDVVVRGFTT